VKYICAQAQRKLANSSDFSKTADAGIVIAQIEQNVKQYEHNKQMHVTNLHKLNTQTLVAKLKEATDIFLHLSRDPVPLKCKILELKFSALDIFNLILNLSYLDRHKNEF
jgi:hypothetical protein